MVAADRITERTLPPRELIRFESMTLDVAGRSLSDAERGEIPLTRSEFELLAAYLRMPGRALSREHLLDVVAGRRGEPFDRSIDMLVGRLRRKIEIDPKAPRLIVAVPGIGYKFTAKPRTLTIPAEQYTNRRFDERVHTSLHQIATHETSPVAEAADELIARVLACKAAGHPGQALEVLADAVQPAAAGAMNAKLSDLYRLRAELLAELGDDLAAEANLLEALRIARQHHADAAELRAAVSLACLWRDQNRRAQAHDLLAPVCARIGNDVPALDVGSARALLLALEDASRAGAAPN